MFQRIPAGNLSLKLTWIWLSLLVCAITFWQLRKLWIRYVRPLDSKAKYSLKLARRFQQRQLTRLKLKSMRKARKRCKR